MLPRSGAFYLTLRRLSKVMSRESELAVHVLSTGYKQLKSLIEMLGNCYTQAECERRVCQGFAFDIKSFDAIESRCINISTNLNLQFSLSYACFRSFLFLPI